MARRITPAILLAAWVGCWLVAFTLTHIPIEPGRHNPIPHMDKVAHFLAYFSIAYLGGLRLHLKSPSTHATHLLVWALVYLAYGAFDELTQPYSGRDCDIVDWVFDALGVTMATLALWRGIVPKFMQSIRDNRGM